MNSATLHAVTEDLASFLSEVTDGDLSFPTPCAGWTVGDLYRHIIEENGKFGRAVSGRPVPAPATAAYRDSEEFAPFRSQGTGYEEIYRASAGYMESAFDEIDDPRQQRQVEGVPGPRPVAELLGMQIADTLIHTWDLARSIDLEYVPRPDVAELVLGRMQAVPAMARGEGRPFAAIRETGDAEGLSVLDRLLLLSGRDIAWVPGTRPEQVTI
jgi:uncharacterized protein (TIGR03086 family)